MLHASASDLSSAEDDTDVSHLREVNFELRAQLSTLKSQYDEAVESLPSIEHLTRENHHLQKAAIELQSKNEDLQKRLDIALQTNSEIVAQRDHSVKLSEEAHVAEVSDYTTQIEELKSELDRLKKSQNRRASKSESAASALQTQVSLLQSQLSKVCSAAAKYFQRGFDSPADLSEFLSRPPAAVPDLSSENSRLRAAAKHFRAKYRREHEARKSLQIRLADVQQEADARSAETLEKMDKFKANIQQYENEISRLQIAQEQRKVCQIALPRLRNNATQTRDVRNPEVEQLKRDNSALAAQIEKAAADFSMVNTKLSAAAEQLKAAELARASLQNKLGFSERENGELRAALNDSQAHTERFRLQLDNAATETASKTQEFERVRVEKDGVIDDVRARNDNAAESLRRLEGLLASQRIEFEALAATKSRLIDLVSKQARFIEAIPIRRPHPQVIEKVVVEEPSIEWDFRPLPTGLAEILGDIAQTGGVPIRQQARHVLTVIAKWIANANAAHGDQLIALERNIDRLQAEKAALFQGMTGLLRKEISDQRSLSQSISEIIDREDELQQVLYDFQSERTRVLTLFSAPTFDYLVQAMKSATDENAIMRTRLRELREQLRRGKRQSRATVAMCERRVSGDVALLQRAIENAREQEAKLQQEIEALREQNQSLLSELKHAREVAEVLMADSMNSSDYFPVRREVDPDEVADYQRQINQLTHTVEHWKSSAAAAQQAITTQGEKHQQALQEHEQQLAALRSSPQPLTPRPELSQSWQRQITQNEVTIGKLQKNIEQIDQKYQTAVKALNEKEGEIGRLKMKIDSQRDQLERAKQMAEIQLKAKLISAQSELSVKLEEQSQSCESRVRNLIGLMLSNFPQYADVQSGLSERSFIECMKRIKAAVEQFKGREASIRRLIKADDSDSIDDALTHFIISNHPSLR
jgi:chromosome segregation ATPase